MTTPNTDMIRNAFELRRLMEDTLKLDGRAEVYTFIPGSRDGSLVFLYTIPQIENWAGTNSALSTVASSPEEALKISKAREITPEEAEAVVLRRAKERGCPPVLLVDWEDGTHVIIDGNHRLIAWGMKGEPQAPAYIIKQSFLLRRGFCRMMSRDLYDQVMQG
jgi:hypothetical protein